VAGARRLENEIRVGLEQQQQPETVSATTVVAAPDPLAVISFGKPVRRHVRDFGTLFALICFGIATWQWYKGRPISSYSLWLLPGVVFGVLGWFIPRALLPIWRGWMKFAHYLSIVMTAVLLTLTWCIGFLPMALVLKLVGIRRVNLAYRDGSESYWEKRDPKYDDFKRLELQY
jgi:hypothetical protein